MRLTLIHIIIAAAMGILNIQLNLTTISLPCDYEDTGREVIEQTLVFYLFIYLFILEGEFDKRKRLRMFFE